jgi:class 3 adenylate cyclase
LAARSPIARSAPWSCQARDDDGITREVRYAKSGDLNIAYQVTGDGPIDLVLVSGFVSHLEMDWEEPRSAYFLERLSSFSRLIRFDKRGTGLSDRPGGVPDLETRMDDMRAVMDAVGSESAATFGYSEGGPMAVLFAATYPGRTTSLVLYGSYAKRLRSEDYPWAPTQAERRAHADEIERRWAFSADLERMCPSADPALARWWEARARAAASPGAARALILMNSQIDVRDVLGSVRVPALVLHRHGDRDSRVEEGRYIAERIPEAKFIELPGVDHVPWIDADQILDEVEEFLTGVRGAPRPGRVLATILVTDLVGSTEKAAELGDRAWSDLLESHHQAIRSELRRFSGEEIDTAGDGFLALFDGPARAIRCALAVTQRMRELGLSVRAGLHTGEVERPGREARGIAVHVSARVAAEAAPEEVLVTATTRDLVAGSGLDFSDRGERTLKGLEEPKRLFAAQPSS